MTITHLESGAERHASWLELFFDLVAVAGIGMLAHLLEEDSSSGGLAVYVIAYTAIWMIWACFTLYGNVAAGQTHVPVILSAMFVLGVMIAAIPEIHGEHATAFAVAYVVGRFLAGRPWDRGTVVADLPIVHAGAGLIPWIVSFWFEGTTQYVLWAVGLGLDLLFLLSTNKERLVAGITDRLARNHRAREYPIDVVDADVPHLTERLGLFVLIVIGEGLVQIIDAASEAEWNRALAVTGAGAFALMFGLWATAVRFGYAGVALLPEPGLSPRLSWPAHLVSTLALATVAALVGDLVAQPHEEVGEHARWLLLTAYAGWALLSAGILLACGERRRAVSVAVALGAASVVVAIATPPAEGTVWILAAGVLGVLGALARRNVTVTPRV